MNKRQQINEAIVKILSDQVKKNPDFRFIQLLLSLGIVNYAQDEKGGDLFYEESEDTIKKLREKVSQL